LADAQVDVAVGLEVLVVVEPTRGSIAAFTIAASLADYPDR
jgi:hypothetical protein